MPAMTRPLGKTGGRDGRGERPDSHVLSTRSVPTHQSMEYWHDAVLSALVGMDITAPGGTYDATMRVDRLGDLQITTVDCDPGEVHRSPRHIAGGDGRQVFVAVQGRGLTRAEQDGRTAELRVGDICFFETVRPFRTSYPVRFQQKIFAVPRELLGRTEADLHALTARALRSAGGLPALLSPFLSRLADVSDTYPADVGRRLGATVADLLAATAAECLGRPADDLPGAQRVLLLRVRGFIRWHLADPGLSPQTVARAHGISVRYLHRLFESEGTTVSRWIRELRLRECCVELAAASGAGPDLGQVARRWGFSGPAHLGRVFRTSLGVSPTDWIQQERLRRDSGRQPWPTSD